MGGVSQAVPTYVEHACPNCRRSLRVRTEYLGRTIVCNHCEHPFLAPAGPAPAAHGPVPGPSEAAAATEVDRLKAELDSTVRRLAEAEGRAEALRAELDPWPGRLAVAEARAAEVDRLEAELRDARDEVGRLGEEVLVLRDRAARSEAAGSGAALQVEDLRGQLDRLRVEREALGDEAARLRAEVEASEAARAGLAAEGEERSREAVRLRAEVEALGRSLAESDEARGAGEARIEALRAEWEARLAGRERAVEAMSLERDDARRHAADERAEAGRRHEAEVARLAAQLEESRGREAALAGRVAALSAELEARSRDRDRSAGLLARERDEARDRAERAEAERAALAGRLDEARAVADVLTARVAALEAEAAGQGRLRQAAEADRDEAARLLEQEQGAASRRAAERDEARAAGEALAATVEGLSAEAEALVRRRDEALAALAEALAELAEARREAQADRAASAGRHEAEAARLIRQRDEIAEERDGLADRLARAEAQVEALRVEQVDHARARDESERTLRAEADGLARRLRRLRSRARRAIDARRRRLDESARQYEQALGAVRAEAERARLDASALRDERDSALRRLDEAPMRPTVIEAPAAPLGDPSPRALVIEPTWTVEGEPHADPAGPIRAPQGDWLREANASSARLEAEMSEARHRLALKLHSEILMRQADLERRQGAAAGSSPGWLRGLVRVFLGNRADR